MSGSSPSTGPRTGEPTRLELAAEHLALRAIGPWLADTLERGGRAGPEAMGAIELAVHELATNSVDHAESPDGRLRLEASFRDGALVVCVIDRGKSVDVAAIERPDEPQVRGYGMMIVEQVATDLRYDRSGEVNRWTATFTL